MRKLTDALDDYILAGRRANLSPATLKGYRKTVQKFARVTGITEMEEFDRRAVERYLDRIIDTVSIQTVAHDYRELKAFARWAKELDLTPTYAMAGVKQPRTPKLLHDVIDDSDFVKLLKGCNLATHTGRRDHAILCFLWDTGVRAGELCGLTDIDLDKRQAKVYGKGAKERFVFFSRETAKSLDRYDIRMRRLRRPGQTFFLTDELRPLSVDTLKQVVIRAKSRAGVTNRCNPHTFRHTFATNYIRAGGDLNSLARLLGHSSLAVVSQYLSLKTDDLEDKHNLYSPMHRIYK